MAKRVGMEVAIAAAEAVGMCNIDMAAVYPITPNRISQSIFRTSWPTEESMPNL